VLMESAMKIVSVVSALALTAAAALMSGCAGYHYSLIDGQRYSKVPIDTYPLQIMRVDGESAPLNPHQPMQVEPGLRSVVVSTYPSVTRRYGEERTMQLQVEPCTRYHLVAVKTSALSNDYTVRIDHQEPVSGCSPPPAKG
jgi:hypothetical protein